MADRDRVLPPGKLPGSMLNNLLDRYITPDPSVLIGPGVGRDAAAIAVGDTAIVVKTDPITFATTDAGRYLVHVNANDIACMGATPRWLLVTALFPERSTTPRMVEEAFAVLATTARELGILLVGGHSEITIGVDRLIQVGQMIGVCDLSELYDLRTAQSGDAILLANGIAIEGTAILASEARGHLARLSDDLLERAAAFLSDPGISVLPAARALREEGVTVRGLHDPTEGGLATAVVELSHATGLGIELDIDRVPVRPETKAICEVLGLDALGLIASGALMAVVAAEDAETALACWERRGITGARIGTLDADPRRCVARRGSIEAPIPTFAVDELARFFAERGITSSP